MITFWDKCIVIFHIILFLMVATLVFLMGVDKAGYQDLANQRIERLSQLSFAELGEIQANGKAGS